ncbi:MAG: hypothetical protein ACPGTI_13405 [bacterium]
MTNLLTPTFHQICIFSGEVATPFEADLSVTARRRLLEELYQLPAGIVLLDLSAGFNVLT